MSAIATNCDVPVSVKCRIGVDDRDSYEELCESSSDTFNFLISSVAFSNIRKRPLSLHYTVPDHTHSDLRLDPIGSCMRTKKMSNGDKLQMLFVFLETVIFLEARITITFIVLHSFNEYSSFLIVTFPLLCWHSDIL